MQKRRGFTLVELLIVIVVIAILAAITIVAYNGVQNRANDAAVQSDLENIHKQVDNFAATTGNVPLTTADLTAINFKFTQNSYASAIYCKNPSGTWAFVAQSTSGNVYEVSDATGNVTAYTFGHIAGISGGTVCPNANVSGAQWQWYLQSTGGWITSFTMT